jgi:hypothetical protein
VGNGGLRGTSYSPLATGARLTVGDHREGRIIVSKRSTVLRGAVTLALLGLLAGALIISPVGAAAPLTKAKVKKIATKVFNRKIGPATEDLQAACASGAVIAWAMLDIDAVGANYSSAPASPQFNCAGGPIEVRDDPDFADGFTNVRVPGVTTGAGGSANVAASVTSSFGLIFPNPLPLPAMGTYHGDAGFDHITVALYNDAGGVITSGGEGQYATIVIYNT